MLYMLSAMSFCWVSVCVCVDGHHVRECNLLRKHKLQHCIKLALVLSFLLHQTQKHNLHRQRAKRRFRSIEAVYELGLFWWEPKLRTSRRYIPRWRLISGFSLQLCLTLYNFVMRRFFLHFQLRSFVHQ